MALMPTTSLSDALRVLATLTRTLAPTLLIVLALCAKQGSAVASTAPTVRFYDGNFECYAGPLALHLPDTYAQLLQLGEVRSTRDVRTQTEHGLTTTERQIEFRGLIMLVHLFSGDPGRYQLASVRIDGPAWQLSPLRVGQAFDAVSLGHGWPGLPPQGSWEVQGDTSHLLVRVRAGRIAAVDYSCDSGH